MRVKWLRRFCVLTLACSIFAGLQFSEAAAKKDNLNKKSPKAPSEEQMPKEKERNTKIKKIPSAEKKSRIQEVKEIEVNSVNFVKLPDKAGEIFIPEPKYADVQMLSDDSFYIMGLEAGSTSIVINDKKGRTIFDCEVRVTYALSAAKRAIHDLYPDSKVEILPLGDSVILKGRVPSPEVAADIQGVVEKFVDSGKIINKLNIETSTQVMIKVKIAEVTRGVTKSLGVNWRAFSGAHSVNGMHYGFASGAAVSGFPDYMTDSLADQISPLINDGIIKKEITGGRWFLHNGGERNQLTGLIDALASESFATVLAEPTLVTVSGKKATFKSGGEKGYTVKQETNDTNTTEFKEWGTSIEFTPIVLSEDRISITVSPKVSTIAYDAGQTTPSLISKEASTTVELGSGQSLAIAGLIQKNVTTSGNATPFLSDLPLVGTLFRNSDVTTDERELVIIITAYIVKPSSEELKGPTDMVPKILGPLDVILSKKFHSRAAKKIDNSGFSIK